MVGSGHVSPRIWEITNKRLGGGADKCENCLYKAQTSKSVATVYLTLSKRACFFSSRTSQDKTSNAESFDSESVTFCRISGCLSDVAKEIADSTTCAVKNILGGCIHTETQ